jgi:hypothetical protein
MPAEISWDLLMDDDMSFVEGTYRLPDREWQVVIISKRSVSSAEVVDTEWESGVTGLHVKWPQERNLNKAAVIELLSAHLGVNAWSEVRGPDSMNLR